MEKIIYLVFRDWDHDGKEFIAAYDSMEAAKNRVAQEEQDYHSWCGSAKTPWPWVIEDTPLKGVVMK